MKNYIFIVFLCFFQYYISQKKQDINFIYHTIDYNFGKITEERIYDSSTGLYEYKTYSDYSLSTDKPIKPIKLYIKFDDEKLNEIQRLYLSSKSQQLSNCYFHDNKLVNRSIIIFNSSIDKINTQYCGKVENTDKYFEIEDKIISVITSSTIYRMTFYWEFYKK